MNNLVNTDIADNLIFAVNGKSKERFALALKLAMNGKKAYGFCIHPNIGLVLYEYNEVGRNITPFLNKYSSEDLVDQLFNWVIDDSTREGIHLPSECNIDRSLNYILKWNSYHPDYNIGWVIYNMRWGCVDTCWDSETDFAQSTICAIAPSYMWLSK